MVPERHIQCPYSSNFNNKNNTSRVYFQSFFRWAPCLKPHSNNPINILAWIAGVTTVATAAAVTAII